MSNQTAAFIVLALILGVALGYAGMEWATRRFHARHVNQAVELTQPFPAPLLVETPSGAPIGDAVLREFAARGERVEA